MSRSTDRDAAIAASKAANAARIEREIAEEDDFRDELRTWSARHTHDWSQHRPLWRRLIDLLTDSD